MKWGRSGAGFRRGAEPLIGAKSAPMTGDGWRVAGDVVGSAQAVSAQTASTALTKFLLR